MLPTEEQLSNYIKLGEMAEEWGISIRRMQALCSTGKIKGAVRLGRDWMIPKNAKRPLDGRTKQGRSGEAVHDDDMTLPRKTPFLHMTDLYNTPGTADECIEKLEYNHLASVLFAAEIAYSRGQIDKVYETANYLLEKRKDFYSTLSAGMLFALCAIWNGDLAMWRRAKMHMAGADINTDLERDIVAFSITAVDSMLYDVASFPEWFKIGCFEPLPNDALPAATVFYAKYLYASAYAVATKELDLSGLSGLTLMSVLPFTIEPMISLARGNKSIIAEIYLRMACAAIYRAGGNDEQAIRHIDSALTLALPDKLYGLIAEYGRTLNPLLEQRISLVDPNAATEIKNLYKAYNEGWSRLSGSVRGKTLVTTLTQKEREVAKLAAFGMQNREIAEKLHISLSSVKQAIRIVMEKTGVSRDEFATIL